MAQRLGLCRNGPMVVAYPGSRAAAGCLHDRPWIDIYAVTPGGVPIAMVNGDEWVINDEMSEEYDRELAMINAGTFPKLPGFENGGRIAAQRAHAGLAAENGKPYGYGQVGNPILGLLELLRSRVRAPEGPRYRSPLVHDRVELPRPRVPSRHWAVVRH
ncbi:hypothetical protein GS941_22460 [Rhodococcus hoagii]|nr:hypothetical protein [Prescottella equi]